MFKKPRDDKNDTLVEASVAPWTRLEAEHPRLYPGGRLVCIEQSKSKTKTKTKKERGITKRDPRSLPRPVDETGGQELQDQSS